MKKAAGVLALALIFGLFSFAVAFSQEENVTADTSATEAPKYGPIFQLEVKDQTNGEAFRGMTIERKFARRLPNYYRDVISDEQRDKIYAIQAAYFSPVEMLTLRLERLKTERDSQIEAVLTAEQKKKIEALTKEATDRAAARRATRTSNN